jgi:hypothetical protein
MLFHAGVIAATIASFFGLDFSRAEDSEYVPVVF